jgi:glycolate oxidase FAD binding subunit
MLRDLFRDRTAVHRLDQAHGAALWAAIRTARPLGAGPLWRINVPPTQGAVVTAALVADGVRWIYDWAGGLIWLASDGDPQAIRSAAARAGGHASLVRAPENVRGSVPFQQPPTPGVGALSARVRRAFDPSGVFETGRFLDEADAD